MSIRQNSYSRISLNTFNKNNSKNSKIQYFSAYPNYIPTKSRKITNRKGSIYLQRMDSVSSNKFRSYNTKRNSKMILTKSPNKKKTEQRKIFYNTGKKLNLKSILKIIKNQFINRYNNIYNYNDILYNNMNNYLLSDYYVINDLLNKKKFRLPILLKEYDILYNHQELLIKFYEKKERYIIMKYLLNFVYKYDELCFDIKKEIYDDEQKEELINTFNYITSNQYLYEHLLDTDSFKGIKFLLKKVNLMNKKAQYDYSYLDLMKNKFVSDENKYIINAIKTVNDFMNNRKFLEKRLIKNVPFSKVPNCIPNYYPLGYELNLSLRNYKISKKHKKIGKPGDKTKELIGSIIEENSKYNSINNKLIDKKNILFNIDEKITENESSIGDSENNYLKNKKTIKENNIKVVSNINNNGNNVLPSSLYEITEKEVKIDKEDDLLINKDDDYKIDYKKIYDKFIPSNNDIRGGRDSEINDIENFISIFPKEKHNYSYFKKTLNKFSDINENKKEKKPFNKDYKNNKNIKKHFKSISIFESNLKKNFSLKNEIDSQKKKNYLKIKKSINIIIYKIIIQY